MELISAAHNTHRPMTQNLDPADKFMLNPKYTSQLMSVVVPLMKAVEVLLNGCLLHTARPDLGDLFGVP